MARALLTAPWRAVVARVPAAQPVATVAGLAATLVVLAAVVLTFAADILHPAINPFH